MKRLPLIVDLRKTCGRDSEDSGASDMDSKVLEAYRRNGCTGVREITGRFGAVAHDHSKNRIIIARDWIGECPLHYYLTDTSLIVANFISDIQDFLGSAFKYEFVRAAPHSHVVEFECGESFEYATHRRRKWRLLKSDLFYDFNDETQLAWANCARGKVDVAAEIIREELHRSISSRASSYGSDAPLAILLSGGIDSFTVAYFLSLTGANITAYTLAVGEGGQDHRRACEIAEHLRIPIKVVQIEPSHLASTYDETIRDCELYHLANVYCAVGMRILARALAEDSIVAAFCGEGVNEAVGDYHDWTVTDPASGEERLLQKVDHQTLSEPAGRIAYLWGCPHQEARFNRQLGSGLAKHGIGRMVKPMLKQGVELECPYLSHNLLRTMAAIPSSVIDEVGGKPGLMAKVMAPEIRKGAFPEHFILNSRKVRLQDASEGGAGGATLALLAAGLDQSETLVRYNKLYGASLIPSIDTIRLSQCDIS